jgi:hypothetical protein
MNASLSPKSPGRLADLNPFDFSVNIKAPDMPPRVIKPAARKKRAVAQAEHGCVDWFQYYAEAGEDKARH